MFKLRSPPKTKKKFFDFLIKTILAFLNQLIYSSIIACAIYKLFGYEYWSAFAIVLLAVYFFPLASVKFFNGYDEE